MKKRFTALVGILAILVVATTGCVSSSLSGTMMIKSIMPGKWTISANSVNGHISQKTVFSADELAALHVKNSSSAGTVSLVLTQDDINKTFDVSGTFDGYIDTSAFTPGKITIRLNLESAKDVNVSVKWK